MIYQILGFSTNNQNLFFRKYEKDALCHEAIKRKVFNSIQQNVITKRDKKIVYKKFNNVIIAFVVNKDENNFYIFEILNKFMSVIGIMFSGICAEDFVCNFDLVLLLLDEYILNGKVLEFNTLRILELSKSVNKM